MVAIQERIDEIEKEMRRTQKNKATEHHLGLLRAKLMKLRNDLAEQNAKTSEKGEGFAVAKSGIARVSMVGFPSVGKSTFLNKSTTTYSKVASYEFTTLTCIPGFLEYGDCKVQLVDLPGIVQGAARGKGRGKEVIAVARTSDLIIMMLEADKAEKQKQYLEAELEQVGIRLNRKVPDVSYTVRKGANTGIKISKSVQLTHCDDDFIKSVLKTYKVAHCDIVLREDCTKDDLIDIICGNTVYIPCIYAINKIDSISMEEMDRLARIPNFIVISCYMDLNIDYLKDQIWNCLQLIRIYTKKKGDRPDIREAIVLKAGSTVRELCASIHNTMVTDFKNSIVWGTSCKFIPQTVGLNHVLENEDV
ncbi:MAG: Developmentally-regulated GTP-binding protein 2, partial [Paramarteilia canceri]